MVTQAIAYGLLAMSAAGVALTITLVALYVAQRLTHRRRR